MFSTISISGNPDNTKFFKISQPIPPAPTTNNFEVLIFSCNVVEKTPFNEAAIILLNFPTENN